MPGFFDWIASGITTAVQPNTSWVNNPNDPNLSRPRVSPSDPTQAIDAIRGLSILNFPHDRPKYYMTFAFEQYERPNQFSGLQSSGLTDYIALPIPNNMKDNNTITYEQKPGHILGEALSLAHENGKDVLKTGSVSDALKQAAANIGDTMGAVAGGVSGWGVNKVVSGLKTMEAAIGEQGATDSVMQVLGMADNPFMTIMLKGPEFKRHHFGWKLSPKSPQESETIKNIVGTLKKMAYPSILTLAEGGFFKYPYICWPKFQPDSVMDYTYKFKPCLITNINVNHSPNDRPGFYTTSAPVEVVLEISLVEIELWRNGDDNAPNDGNLPTTAGDFSQFQTPPGRRGV